MNAESVKNFFTSLTLDRIIPTILILVCGIIAVKLLTKLFTKLLSRSKLDPNLAELVMTVFRFLLYTLIFLIAAEALGFKVSSLIALFSVLSLAITLAVQGTLANVAGNVQILLAHPFRLGDFVEIGSCTGTVRKIGLLYTRIDTLDSKCIFLPNSEVAGSTIINYTHLGKRRVDLQFSASYDSAPETVRAALTRAAEASKRLKDEPIFCRTLAYDDSAIRYELRVWCRPEDYWDVYFDVTERVYDEFAAAGVIMTYPHMNVHMDS